MIKKIGTDPQYLQAVILQTGITLNMNDKEKEDYELNVENKNVALQKWLTEHYLNAIYSAAKNAIRISKYVKLSEKLFLSSIISGIIISIMSIIKIIS